MSNIADINIVIDLTMINHTELPNKNKNVFYICDRLAVLRENILIGVNIMFYDKRTANNKNRIETILGLIIKENKLSSLVLCNSIFHKDDLDADLIYEVGETECVITFTKA